MLSLHDHADSILRLVGREAAYKRECLLRSVISHIIYSSKFQVLRCTLMLYAFFLEHSDGNCTDIAASFRRDVHGIQMEDIVEHRSLFQRIGVLCLVSSVLPIIHAVRQGHHGVIHSNSRLVEQNLSVCQHSVTTSAPIMVSYPHAVVQHKNTLSCIDAVLQRCF